MHKEIPSTPPPLVCRSGAIDFQKRSYLMGIINVTPDSFSDGGNYYAAPQAVAHGLALAEQGADILDIGGESSRPGAAPVSAAEEIARVVPVIKELAAQVTIPISIDTTKAEVARQALDAGAELVNDISALRFDPAMAGVVAACKVPVILMHMLGTPQTMQHAIRYDSLIADIGAFLRERIAFAVHAGIERDKIIIDPGLGFGKSVSKDNFTIISRLGACASLGRPILVGPSRKACIGKLLNAGAAGRDEGTAAAVAIAVYNGAHLVRVHNVGMMKMVVQVADAIKRAG
ncbi:MAG: dihydropteroate synthase [Pseudomonadota bacterium]